MGLIIIPGSKNVGKSLDDINANFAYLDKASVDKFGMFENTTPTKTWIVNHGMQKKPSVTVVDNYGDVVLCDIEYVDDNTVRLKFSEETAGIVYLN